MRGRQPFLNRQRMRSSSHRRICIRRLLTQQPCERQAPLEYILPLHQRHLRLRPLWYSSPVRLTSQSLRICGICFSPLPIDAFVPALQRQTVWRVSLTCCTWPQPVSKRTLSVVSASSRAACAILIIIFLRLPVCSACSRLTTRRPLRSFSVRVLPYHLLDDPSCIGTVRDPALHTRLTPTNDTGDEADHACTGGIVDEHMTIDRRRQSTAC